MARQYKRIQRKIAPKRPQPVRTQGNGRDLLLIAMCGFLIFILATTWTQLDAINRATYGSLLTSFLLIYAQKHGHFSANVVNWMRRFSIFFTIFALLLFLLVCYQYFMR